jgi:hypothetical protein
VCVDRIPRFAYQFIVSAHNVCSRLSLRVLASCELSQLLPPRRTVARSSVWPRGEPDWAAPAAACCSPIRAAQDSNVLFRSLTGYVNQISVAGMLEFPSVFKSNPLLCRVSANEVKAAGTRSGSAKCISMRVTGSDPPVPTTRTLLMVAPELVPNILRAISPGETFLSADALAQAGLSVFRRMGADDAAPWPFAPFRSGTSSAAPISRSQLSFPRRRPISRSSIGEFLDEVTGCSFEAFCVPSERSNLDLTVSRDRTCVFRISRGGCHRSAING